MKDMEMEQRRNEDRRLERGKAREVRIGPSLWLSHVPNSLRLVNRQASWLATWLRVADPRSGFEEPNLTRVRAAVARFEWSGLTSAATRFRVAGADWRTNRLRLLTAWCCELGNTFAKVTAGLGQRWQAANVSFSGRYSNLRQIYRALPDLII